MRVPYAPPTPPPSSDPSLAAIYSRISARRYPRPLLPLDLALLHNPNIADGWNSLLGAIRSTTTLDPAVVELAICRVAVINCAVFEWDAHAPLALQAGVTKGALEKVLRSGTWIGAGMEPSNPSQSAQRELERERKRSNDSVASSGAIGDLTNPNPSTTTTTNEDRLTPLQLTVLQYTDAMTRDIVVSDEVFERLKTVAGFSDTQCVELTSVIAAYNCVSRFLVALDVGERNGGAMEVPE